MGWLKLIIQVTPYDYDNDLRDFFIAKTEDIRDWIKEKMISYLRGELIRIQNHTPIKIKDSASFIALIESSSIRRVKGSFFTSITVKSPHASFVEFGTGLHGQLPGSGDIITTRFHRNKITGKMEKPKVLHWKDSDGDHFYASVKGQYPKPFMRASVMKLKYQEELLTDVMVETQIVYPKSANFERKFGGL